MSDTQREKVSAYRQAREMDGMGLLGTCTYQEVAPTHTIKALATGSHLTIEHRITSLGD